jgi:hypothetical protein
VQEPRHRSVPPYSLGGTASASGASCAIRITLFQLATRQPVYVTSVPYCDARITHRIASVFQTV